MVFENEPKPWKENSWKLAPGEHIEVHLPPAGTRRGVIEVVMHDKSGFWLASNGVEPRVFISLEEKGLSIQPVSATPGNRVS